ncbi:hypothetical protein DAEQUDRAFT_689656 [Daedalea quercina L-15889]|uniref:Uncharacterized protein n=1 Tax=Daedalea quercina L-15889 TaxID=1314783 RepID=A0A165R085_9APHY|nr:hypothetical protein DAEQUDRAFT_689656 [Daedalea quercina L-15889]
MMPSRTDVRGSDSRHVNNLLHTLRGEQYRHEQNLQRAKARGPIPSLHNYPTLPFDQIYTESTAQPEPPSSTRQSPLVHLGPEGILEYAYPRGRVPGPRPPPSWSGLFAQGGEGKDANPLGDDERAWRSNALSLIHAHLSPSSGSGVATIPRLTLLCLQYLVSLYPGQDASDVFAEDVVPYIPGHLRRDLMRWSAVHDPLPTSKLLALAEPDGHVDGELIVVGPRASLPRDIFRWPMSRHVPAGGTPVVRTVEEETPDALESWDSPSSEERVSQPMRTLVLLSVTLPVTTLLTFPPTLTHLALLAVPTHTPIFRLPRVCPLIEVLDISFNKWLGQPHAGSSSVLQRIEWDRWSRLRVLALRGTGVGEEIVSRVNKGRWVDVDIVGTVPLEIAMSNLTLGL